MQTNGFDFVVGCLNFSESQMIFPVLVCIIIQPCSLSNMIYTNSRLLNLMDINLTLLVNVSSMLDPHNMVYNPLPYIIYRVNFIFVVEMY